MVAALHTEEQTQRVTVLIMAKVPRPGAVKTRLCPPCSHEQAAALAHAALLDTIDAARATGAPVVLALEGGSLSGLPEDVATFAQQGASFAERLAHAWAQVETPAVQIAMDTPQVTADALREALAAARTGTALGLAEDGGWWIIGFSDPPPPGVFDVEMSAPDTGKRQRARLEGLGLEVFELPPTRDVDEWEDALHVAHLAPDGRFAAAVGAIMSEHRRNAEYAT